LRIVLSRLITISEKQRTASVHQRRGSDSAAAGEVAVRREMAAAGELAVCASAREVIRDPFETRLFRIITCGTVHEFVSKRKGSVSKYLTVNRRRGDAGELRLVREAVPAVNVARRSDRRAAHDVDRE
jgi:hypothetical protein